MLFSTKWLASIFPIYEGDISENKKIDSVTIDSREVKSNALFIPIVGDRFDGHDFANDAIEAGAVALLWEKDKPLPKNLPSHIALFFVHDTLESLQNLAKKYRTYINPYVIGITGSNGKTTTKDIVAAILRTTYETHATAGNFNNHIGLPLTIVNMPRSTEMLVLEMGMNNFGEIEKLSLLAQPDIGIIVNIGESHIEHLGSRSGIAKAKLEIKQGLKSDGDLIIDGDEQLLQHAYEQDQVITCGYESHNDIVISNINDRSVEKSVFELNNKERYELPLIGRHNILNATYAIVLAKRVNISIENIQKGLNHIDHTSMRMEFSQGKNGVTIINDAYNASPTSMKAAIDVIKSLPENKDKVLVLGDLLELGNYAEQFHRDIADYIDSEITAVFTLGKLAKIIHDEIKQQNDSIRLHHSTTYEQLIDHLQQYLNKNTVILFKASRGLKFENLVNAIS